MKFHKARTAISSEIEGLGAYRSAFERGELRPIYVSPTEQAVEEGLWRRLPATSVKVRHQQGLQPLEISIFPILPRAAVVDELTRHRETTQIFMPIVGRILVAMCGSIPGQPNRPDPDQLMLVPACPGEAVEVGIGTWHTLPFCFVSEVVCASVMHCEDLDSYHDVRDLAAEGWIGLVEWIDG